MTHVLTRLELWVHASAWHLLLEAGGRVGPEQRVENVRRLLADLPDAFAGAFYDPKGPGGMKVGRARPGGRR